MDWIWDPTKSKSMTKSKIPSGKEKNVLAVQDKKEIIAIGEDAYQMYEKTPPDIEVAFPMRDGVISRFNDMQNLLQNILKRTDISAGVQNM